MSETKRLALMSGVIGAIVTAALYIFFHGAPPVQAQGPIGNVNFAQPFSVTMGNTISYVSIKNIGQSAGSVQFLGASGDLCPILLEGSANNTNWWVLASSSPGPSNYLAATGQFYANGFASYYRLAFNPNSLTNCDNLTLSGSYYGYIAPLPINRQDNWYYMLGIGNVQQVTPAGMNFFGVDGFQCTNTAAAEAYLQLFTNPTVPSLGNGFFYQIGLAAGQTFSTQGVAGAVASNTLWAGAATAAGGSTAGGPLICDFQINSAGPFYPLLPVGP